MSSKQTSLTVYQATYEVAHKKAPTARTKAIVAPPGDSHRLIVLSVHHLA